MLLGTKNVCVLVCVCAQIETDVVAHAIVCKIGKLFLILSHWCVPPNMRLRLVRCICGGLSSHRYLIRASSSALSRQMNPNIDLSAFEVMMPVESVACSKAGPPDVQ
eukprot:239348-Amphidinium_carterae.1